MNSELKAKDIHYCYSCGTNFPWEEGPNPYCGQCGARQLSGCAFQSLPAEFTEISTRIA